ncbi:hypothetical protein J421_3850 [Gemmatirosa kalamazoonensis]|uniref:Uncharacterized protein n=1 Tax=Gemmatirosa kalamazoonensis TaxID=861299 RepID=W0RLQ5_9BACT|nr:hypothetical protein [Gemmatirosa kalamazoonensis]AHG91387.1 hypothetical protein J421_3850 [Gemmatirosa kalamazoonensis]
MPRARAGSALLLAATACTAYHAVPPEHVATGARVRVTLTTDGAAALASRLGGAVTGVEGKWVGERADSIDLRVDRLLTAAGAPVDWSGGPVAIARGAVQSVEQATVSRSRTTLLVGGVAAAGAALLAIVHRGGGAKGEPTGGGQPGL